MMIEKKIPNSQRIRLACLAQANRFGAQLKDKDVWPRPLTSDSEIIEIAQRFERYVRGSLDSIADGFRDVLNRPSTKRDAGEERNILKAR